MTNNENTNESLKKYADIHQKKEKSGMLNGLTQSQIENNINFFEKENNHHKPINF